MIEQVVSFCTQGSYILAGSVTFVGCFISMMKLLPEGVGWVFFSAAISAVAGAAWPVSTIYGIIKAIKSS